MLNFTALGDWGRRGSEVQQQVAHQMGRIADYTGNDFIISTGDNFYENGVESIDDDHWGCSFADVYTAPSLMTPWYSVLGNHDYRGNVQAQIDYTALNPRWQMPAHFYTVVHPIENSRYARFIFLDTTPFVEEYCDETSDAYLADAAAQDKKAQLKWLDATLSNSTADWNIVVGHHPIYSSSPCHGDTEELVSDVLPILKKHHVPVYLCGHDHNLQHLKPDGNIHYFVSGAASHTRQTEERAINCFTDDCCGFMTASLTPDYLHIRFFNADGQTIHTTLIERENPSMYITLDLKREPKPAPAADLADSFSLPHHTRHATASA